MAMSRHEQLVNFAPSYRAGYVSAGGRDEDLKTDEDIVKKLEAHGEDVNDEADAERAGRDDGYADREAAKKRGHW